MNHAVFVSTPYFRSISRAATPFFDEHISKTTKTHLRTGILVPWKIVPVSTENCFRQSAHFQTRRSDTEPVRVFRDAPLRGVRKYGLRTEPQCGQTGVSPHRSSSRNR